uniref:MADS-box domain-containing protein n=1 Tax=Gossypium raimondii TaxID=29730 RepID=A0A0D2UJN8_GOSRA|nr:hypothetical protein B456_011G158700 [Gossypium raimondii]
MNSIQDELHSEPPESLLGQENWGRRKIEIKIIENKDDRLISFSKRCTRIYKKTFELFTLFGSEILFIILSPTGKSYSFGHHFFEIVTKRILNTNQPLNETTHAPFEAYHKLRIHLLV